VQKIIAGRSLRTCRKEGEEEEEQEMNEPGIKGGKEER